MTATLAALLVMGLIVVASMAVSSGESAAASLPAVGGQLRPDAPVPPEYWQWVVSAGGLCPEVTPAAIAAQIEVESSWNADAYADSGEVPARGIAQFTDATWQTWGSDYDRDGTNSPYDPQDGIMAMGKLMCDLVRWAKEKIDAGVFRGDPLDIAWAAYHGGRGTVERYGGVPPLLSGSPLTAIYPKKVRDKIAKYAAAPLDISAPGAPGAGGWVLPLPPGHTVGSKFAMRCMRQSSGNVVCRMHNGVDVGAPTGTPIYAANSGNVVTAACDSPYCDRPGNVGLGGCGYYVKIQHGGNVGTMYCHLVRMNVSAGQPVAAGQVIGWVGSTGNSSGPHLHFQIHRTPPFNNSTAVDPESFLRSVGLVFR